MRSHIRNQRFSSAHMVLLKEVKADQGFIFFTNYVSRKVSSNSYNFDKTYKLIFQAQIDAQIDANPNVALVFYWKALVWSVRIEGKAERIPASESEDYFMG